MFGIVSALKCKVYSLYWVSNPQLVASEPFCPNRWAIQNVSNAKIGNYYEIFDNFPVYAEGGVFRVCLRKVPVYVKGGVTKFFWLHLIQIVLKDMVQLVALKQ